MSDPRAARLPLEPPAPVAPPPSVERRNRHRRAADRQADAEKLLLARALDVLVGARDAESKLAGLLGLLARTAGARRAAVLASGGTRRTAVAVARDEDPAAAAALAAWLDANAPRTRAERAAAGLAPVSLAVAADDAGPVAAPRSGAAEQGPPHRALQPVRGVDNVVFGFEFDTAGAAAALPNRLPPELARHAAAALALVTEQLAVERELADLRAQDVERARFVSTVAHELRTPLTGLSGYLGLILDGQVADPDVQREFLDRSRAIVGTMGELVDDLLELSRLESGTLRLESAPFSIAEVTERVAASLMPIALDQGLDLRTIVPPRMRVATGDRRRVEQILTNLAANAMKFSPAGGRVELEARVDGSVVLIVVRDDGAGISSDERPRIFERFHRLPDHELISGTGLGLPIARDLARRMDGDLDLASVPGSGSAFVLALPGPAGVDDSLIADALARSLAAEEVRLEERAVLRALSAAGRAAVIGQPADDAPPDGSRSADGPRHLRLISDSDEPDGDAGA